MYSKETLKSKSIEELATIAQALGSSLTAADGTDALIEFIANGASEEPEEAPKPKRTRKTAAKAEDGQDAAVVDAPKKKRGRPKKSETIVNEVENTIQEDNAETKTVETAPVVEESENAQEQTEAPKRRRRRTKEEIAAAAAAAAAALALTNKKKAALEQEIDFEASAEAESNNAETNTSESEDSNYVPEQMFKEESSENTSEESNDLLAQLQAKVNSRKPETTDEDSVWEDDPADGTDFIIVKDLPIEEYDTQPSYSILDTPTQSYEEAKDVHATEDAKKDPKVKEFDFSNIITVIGVLEIMPDGFGFLRSSDYNYLSSPDDIFVTAQQVKRNSLKTGDVVECLVRPPMQGEKFFTLTEIKRINGCDPVKVRDRVAFENLTPLFPDEKFMLCGDPATANRSVRIVDLFSPIGKGQRALIVAQPKTGKTILMKDIANAIAANHPEAYLMILLIDERPEEVTDMARTVNAEVIASTFDEPAEHHVKIAGIVLEKAKRLVECGHDVVIFLDSITRLARAYNTVAPASGKILTGGVDANALQKPKRFFGAARNIEGGGSLTIIATALIDTGSKMDEVIFEEFKGTGNMELQLDRSLSNKRIFPAVNLVQSSTRRDDLLQDKTTLDRMWILRKHIAEMNAMEAMMLIDKTMTGTRNNEEFLMSMNG